MSCIRGPLDEIHHRLVMKPIGSQGAFDPGAKMAHRPHTPENHLRTTRSTKQGAPGYDDMPRAVTVRRQSEVHPSSQRNQTTRGGELYRDWTRCASQCTRPWLAALTMQRASHLLLIRRKAYKLLKTEFSLFLSLSSSLSINCSVSLSKHPTNLYVLFFLSFSSVNSLSLLNALYVQPGRAFLYDLYYLTLVLFFSFW